MTECPASLLRKTSRISLTLSVSDHINLIGDDRSWNQINSNHIRIMSRNYLIITYNTHNSPTIRLRGVSKQSLSFGCNFHPPGANSLWLSLRPPGNWRHWAWNLQDETRCEQSSYKNIYSEPHPFGRLKPASRILWSSAKAPRHHWPWELKSPATGCVTRPIFGYHFAELKVSIFPIKLSRAKLQMWSGTLYQLRRKWWLHWNSPRYEKAWKSKQLSSWKMKSPK